jgi:hypothetical protein
MSSRWRRGFAILFALAACDNDRSTGGGGVRNNGGSDSGVGRDVITGGGDGGDASTIDTGVADSGPGDSGTPPEMIPNPPETEAFSWNDVEPNDTPSRAVPVGRLQYALWMGFSAQPNVIGNNTDVDYYAFRTGDAQSLMNQADMVICSNDGQDLLTAKLYSVIEGMQGEELRASTRPSEGCALLMTSVEVPTVLMPMSVYLLEIRALPGLELGARIGAYSA